MASKIGVIADTNACLDYFENTDAIKIMRSMIHLGDEEFIDHEELTAEAFYERLVADKSLFPRTSQCSMGRMVEMYESYRELGYTDIIVVTISSHMSGTYSSAVVAANQVNGINVHVFDSKSVAFPQAKMALKALELAQQGESVETILEALSHIRDNNHIFFAVDTLAYLVKNGRLSNAQGLMGSMLKIKPLLHISKEGKVENIEKIRTFRKAVDTVIARYIEETKDKDVEPFICHAHNEETRDYIIEKLKEQGVEMPLFTMPLTPAVGAHAGPGAIGLGYYERQK